MLQRANGELIVAGSFLTTSGNTTLSRIARWNGIAWQPLDTGTNGPIHALAELPNGDIIAGGAFGIAGSAAAWYLARWDGSAWSAVNPGPTPGMDARVLALAPYGGKLYAGGEFTTAGGVAASRIAMWDGSTWAPLGSGVSGKVLALHVFDGKLIVGGEFATAGGLTVNLTSSPTRRSNIASMSETMPYKSRTVGSTGCLRLKASNWPVREAALSPALRISSMCDSSTSPRRWRSSASSQ